jgi:DNA polymerase-1
MHLLLVDGSGFIFRAFHALPQLTRKTDGLPVGSVIGFCNMMYKLMEDLEGDDRPTHIAVVFDYSSKTFRDEIYSEYKAQRPPPPNELIPQFPLTRTAAKAYSMVSIEMEGWGRRYHRDLHHAGARAGRQGDDRLVRQGFDAARDA